jgi:hypothetical protein
MPLSEGEAAYLAQLREGAPGFQISPARLPQLLTLTNADWKGVSLSRPSVALLLQWPYQAGGTGANYGGRLYAVPYNPGRGAIPSPDTLHGVGGRQVIYLPGPGTWFLTINGNTENVSADVAVFDAPDDPQALRALREDGLATFTTTGVATLPVSGVAPVVLFQPNIFRRALFVQNFDATLSAEVFLDAVNPVVASQRGFYLPPVAGISDSLLLSGPTCWKGFVAARSTSAVTAITLFKAWEATE